MSCWGSLLALVFSPPPLVGLYINNAKRGTYSSLIVLRTQKVVLWFLILAVVIITKDIKRERKEETEREREREKGIVWGLEVYSLRRFKFQIS